MEEIILSKLVELKLEKLVHTLYQKEYFGFMNSAIEYVRKIKGTMYAIPVLPHSKTKNDRYGKWYVTHKSQNKRTQYKITFDKKDNRYLVKNIISTHEKAYPKYIRGKN